MKNQVSTILSVIILTVFLYSCSNDDENPDPAPSINAISELRAYDVSNNGNATDIELSLKKPTELTNIEEFRAFIIPTAELNQIDTSTATGLEANRYLMIGINEPGPYNLNGSLLDYNGDNVIEGVDYSVFVLSISKIPEIDSKLSSPATINLERKTAIRTVAVVQGSGTGGMDVDNAGNIFMGDFGDDTNGGGTGVNRITVDGSISEYASGFQTATGNDFDGDGNLFQSSFSNNTIFKISPDGTKTIFASGSPINGPVGLAFDQAGDLYVANYNGNSILRIASEGTIDTFSSTSSLNGPNGIDFDNEGNLYVSNWLDGNITKITPGGNASVLTTVPSGQNAHLLIHDEEIYFVARSVHIIYKVSLSGLATRYIGTGTRGGINGSLSEATLSYPNDLAFSVDGTKMYINHNSPEAAGTTILAPSIIREVDIVN